MKGKTGDVFFLVLQILWTMLWLGAMIWAYASTDSSVQGEGIRGEVASFRLHFASVLAQLAAVFHTRWRFLIPLFMVQFVIGIFSTIEVALYSHNLGLMHPLYEFTLYGVGVYQLVILLMGLIYYGGRVCCTFEGKRNIVTLRNGIIVSARLP